MKELLLATRNRGKVAEIKELLADVPAALSSLLDGFEFDEVEEDGRSFAENALKKAVTIARQAGKLTLADDSGLLVDALNGEPGVRSSRYFGPGLTDHDKVKRMLELLLETPAASRGARFQCVTALALPDGRSWTAEGSCVGIIIREARGRHGFGYDPIFLVPELNKTFAELSSTEKQRFSHRGRAVRAIMPVLMELVSER